METLRSEIIVLFSSEEYVPFVLNPTTQNKPIIECIDSASFNCKFKKSFGNISLEQSDMAMQLCSEYYTSHDDGSSEFTFASGRNIFNTLVFFTKEVLVESCGSPICRFEHLLRWHSVTSIVGEDLLTTSFLASKDIKNNFVRSIFDWSISVCPNDPQLAALFSKPIADIHMHLKASSLNFDLSWLCLMNHIRGRSEELRELESSLSESPKRGQLLYAMLIKAYAIRLYLYGLMSGNQQINKREVLLQIIFAETNLSTIMLSSSLDNITESLRYVARPEKSDVDYMFCTAWEAANHNFILTGERMLLYKCFRACYAGEMDNFTQHLFYSYLLIKNYIRHCLVQSDASIIGFKNFKNFETRKSILIDRYPRYCNLVAPLAIFQYSNSQRYVEARITPKNTARELDYAISAIDSQVQDMNYPELSYVLHFIKKYEKEDFEYLYPCRNQKLRNSVKRQALAIHNFRAVSKNFHRVVGIDAANSEIAARPEVFAQPFRFLRCSTISRTDRKTVKTLGLTYHVGEAFLSIIDGLRAIDEVLHFLPVQRGDRLGHALALGVNVREYAKNQHCTVVLPKQILLDDLVWAILSSEQSTLTRFLEKRVYDLFRDIYGCDSQITVYDYYDSWLLRGDNPLLYEQYLSLGHITLSYPGIYSHYDLNPSQEACEARKNPKACKLYHAYHYSAHVRREGLKAVEFKYADELIAMMGALQSRLLSKLSKMGIGIETNPTSNLRIGGLEMYEKHPIFKFYPICSDDRQKIHLPVTINTDDRGIFATSIEREYALLACSLYKKGYTVHDICQWLDSLRVNSLSQRF